MKVTYKYFKNSNTDEIVFTQEFSETNITGIPVYLYNYNREQIGQNIPLVGFVEISEKKFNRLAEKLIKAVN